MPNVLTFASHFVKSVTDSKTKLGEGREVTLRIGNPYAYISLRRIESRLKQQF